ncbi:MAG: TIGR00725 family protein [Actinomycetales bacterium]
MTQVAVCGPRHCADEEAENAYRVGRLLAARGVVVVCGGGIGVMAAVSAGAREAGGTVVGIRPDDDPAAANQDLSITIFTNLGEARNAVIVWSADAVIAIGGSWGTLSEVALAKRRGGIPVVQLGGWHVTDAEGQLVPGIHYVDTAEDAVRAALTTGQT